MRFYFAMTAMQGKIQIWGVLAFAEASDLLKTGEYIMVCCNSRNWHIYLKRLSLNGYIFQKDFFDGVSFLKCYLPIWIYAAFKKCYIDFLGVPANWKCTLRCKECSANMPYFNKRNPSYQEYVSAINQLFAKVDYIHTFDLTGGETFVNSDFLADIIVYLVENYLEKIGEFLITTNATIIPTERLLAILNVCKDRIRINVSLYETVAGWSEKFEQFQEKLIAYDIPFYKVCANAWIPMWNRGKPILSQESDMQEKYNQCANFCRGYIDGKLYYCTAAYCANEAYIHTDMSAEALDIGDDETTKIHIIEYLCGFCQWGYSQSCRYCKGWGDRNVEKIPVAEQLI